MSQQFSSNQEFYPSRRGSGGSDSGIATVLATNTFIDVAHDLGVAPSSVQVTPRDEIEGRDFWVSNIGAATFRINISMVSLANDYDFDWRAEP